MTDAEHAAVLRRFVDLDNNLPWDHLVAAIERAIELLEREAPLNAALEREDARRMGRKGFEPGGEGDWCPR